jgi:Tfp pilus assembly protein PilP
MRIRITLALVAGLVTPAAGQSPAPAATVANTSATAAPTAQLPVKTDEPAGYTYHAEGRRDPFVSLLKHGPELQRGAAGARAAGLAGLAAAEVTLKGTMQGRDGYVAMMLGADTRTYIVHPGDRLADGTIRAISSDSIVIVQQVNDPLSPQKQREVRKMLRQSEEAK